MVCIEGIETAGVHEGGKIGIPHFLDLATDGADQMGVGQGDAFILHLQALKHMSPQHLCFNQQFDGIIHCRTAHPETVPVNQLLQLLDSEMPVDIHDAVQDGVPLRGMPHTMSIQILIELTDNGIVAARKIFDIWVGFHRMDKITTFFAIKQRIEKRNMFCLLEELFLLAASQHTLYSQFTNGTDSHVAERFYDIGTQRGGNTDDTCS